MNRTKLVIASLASLAILSTAPYAFAKTAQTRSDYTSALDHASSVYRDAHAKCEPLLGHDKDMCVVEAKAVEKRSKAAAQATYKGTVKSMTDRNIAYADADLMVAKVACETKTANDKDVCVKQAQATQVKLVADARAHKTAVDARAGAREDTRDAQYDVAVAKCAAMTGSEKDACVATAKVAYGK
jgi:hypothetical protein